MKHHLSLPRVTLPRVVSSTHAADKPWLGGAGEWHDSNRTWYQWFRSARSPRRQSSSQPVPPRVAERGWAWQFRIARCALGIALGSLLAVQTAGAFTNLTYMGSASPTGYISQPGSGYGTIAMSGDTLVVGVPGESGGASGVNGGAPDNQRPGSGAAFVFVRDGTNWVEQAYLKASNPDTNDFFGYSVAISGDTIVVGAIREDSNATGVNGNQANNAAQDSGAAYVFVRSGTNWSQQAYLKASNPDPFDLFGIAVGISGDTIVVGAQGESSNATGVNGNQSNNDAPNSGAAYVFVRSGTTWSQQAYLKASNTRLGHVFGSAVGIASNTIVVGASRETSNATGVNGNDANNTLFQAGAAFVFTRTGTTWSQQAYLKASNTDAADQFGTAVAIAGDTVVIGAPGEASNATGVNGNQADNSAQDAGAAYVFLRTGTTWSQQAYLKASNTEGADEFGGAVAIHGDLIVVGAPGEDSETTGVNGNQADNSRSSAGAAYVFSRSGDTWSQSYYLKSEFAYSFARFGSRLAISDDWVATGEVDTDSVYLFADQAPPPPTLPSRIDSITVTATEVTLHCTGQPEVIYNILRADALEAGWGFMDQQVAQTDGTFMSVDTDPLPDGAFYILQRVQP
jgi:hypothetical protein